MFKSTPLSEDLTHDPASIRDAAIKRLARREHSVSELRRKLRDRGYDSELIHEILTTLQSENLLSDERFAESYLVMRAQAGFGPVRIQEELKARGVSESLIHQTFQQVPEARELDWTILLELAWQKKFKGQQPKTPQDLAKQIRFLQQRGFELGAIRGLLD